MKFRLITLTLTLLCASEAFANNAFIPNYYRNRRQMNSYSALGWSNRHEVGAQYSVENTDVKTNGTKTSDDEATELRPYIYYRTPVNLNIEAQILRTDSEDQALPAAGPKAKTEAMQYDLGLGYELTNVPMAVGLEINSQKRDLTSSAGTKTDREEMGISLGFGYRLEGDLYLGAGYTREEEKATATKDNIDNTYSVGVGKVYGDRANPTATSEAVLTFANEDHVQAYGVLLQGLMNHSETIQYYGGVNYGMSDGPVDTTSYSAMAGADLKFADFYVGPQISWLSLEIKTTGYKTETTALVPSIEAGYRIDFAEAFLRYDMNSLDREVSGLATSKTEFKGNTLTAGLAYKF